MIQLKRQIKIFKIPTKNTWWLLKLSANIITESKQSGQKLKTKENTGIRI